MDYYNKYLKYKSKYNKMKGGGEIEDLIRKKETSEKILTDITLLIIDLENHMKEYPNAPADYADKISKFKEMQIKMEKDILEITNKLSELQEN